MSSRIAPSALLGRGSSVRQRSLSAAPDRLVANRPEIVVRAAMTTFAATPNQRRCSRCDVARLALSSPPARRPPRSARPIRAAHALALCWRTLDVGEGLDELPSVRLATDADEHSARVIEHALRAHPLTHAAQRRGTGHTSHRRTGALQVPLGSQGRGRTQIRSRRGALSAHQSRSSPRSRMYARALASASQSLPLDPQNIQSCFAARL